MSPGAGDRDDGRIPFCLFVGVTGHRALPADHLLRERVRAALHRIHERCPADSETPLVLTAVSALAEGADRLVAQAVLDEGGMLEAVLPMPLACYVDDFASDHSRGEFRSLLDRASRVSRGHRRPQDQEEREGRYKAAGQHVVRRCDVLVALWDGQSARGRGGTAEMVALARALGKPLFWIKTEPPYELTEERIADLPDAALLLNMREFNRATFTQAEADAAAALAARDLLPLTPPPASRLQAMRDWIVPYYVRADLLAVRYQRRFNLLSNAVYFLAFLAIVAGLAQVLFAADRPLLAAPEAAFLVAILALVAAERRRRMGTHDRWMVYRFLAERLRSAFFLAAADVREGYDIDFACGPLQEVSERWLARALTSVYSQCPRGRAHTGDVPPVAGLLKDAWLQRQIDYHAKAETRHAERHQRLTRLLYAIFGLTLAAVIVHFAGITSEGSVVTKVVVMCAIGLPALGAALSGLRSHLQPDHHAARHHDMRQLLTTISQELGRPESLPEIRAQAVRIEEALLTENTDWLRQISFSVLEPVA